MYVTTMYNDCHTLALRNTINSVKHKKYRYNLYIDGDDIEFINQPILNMGFINRGRLNIQ